MYSNWDGYSNKEIENLVYDARLCIVYMNDERKELLSLNLVGGKH